MVEAKASSRVCILPSSNKSYVDNEIAKIPKHDTDVLKLDGSKAMTGILNMNAHPVIGIQISAADNAPLTVGGAKATYLPLLGNHSMPARQSKYGRACYYKYQAFCRR